MDLLAIVGPHRSGTSVTAGVLHHLGVEFGPRLMPPSPANPSGYFESLRVVEVHDVLLRSMDRAWDDVRPLPEGWERRTSTHMAAWRLVRHLCRFRGRVIGVKDPRMCWLLPLWKLVALRLGARLVPVVVARNMDATIASLARREQWPREQAQELVDSCVRGCFEWVAHPRAVVVKYEELLRDWRAYMGAVNDAVQGELPSRSLATADDVAEIEAAVDKFIDRGLQHHA